MQFNHIIVVLWSLTKFALCCFSQHVADFIEIQHENCGAGARIFLEAEPGKPNFFLLLG